MDENLTVEVDAADLLWVLIEYGILAAVSEQDGLPQPPSMDAAVRLTEAIPEGSVDLPAEALPSVALADFIATSLGA